MTGRPRIIAHDGIAKPCEACGKVFRLRDKKFQTPARFARRRYCSRACAGCDGGAGNFWDRVDQKGAAACWEWQRKRNRKGYGQLTLNGKQMGAHRAAYILAVGAIPDGMQVLHSCDNPPCCNPKHLSLGTNLDNVRDCAAKGRRASQKK
jgi:hypothetical protein